MYRQVFHRSDFVETLAFRDRGLGGVDLAGINGAAREWALESVDEFAAVTAAEGPIVVDDGSNRGDSLTGTTAFLLSSWKRVESRPQE